MRKLVSVFSFLLATMICDFVVAQTNSSLAKNSDTAKVVISRNYGVSNLIRFNPSKTENQNPVILEPEKTTLKSIDAAVKNKEAKIENIPTLKANQENIQSVAVAEKSAEDEKTKE